ncbi:hypothetical protein RHMOL_Rhmol01G0136700 [Rhododendron molle]|uniref:Uncharacterized protein n=1 Tax=Rhododendron molle TaxID=49168 RepID=A0ACC0Q3V6_RHOML|nr:hypothetical protein RHMOL_Rhmol01G0136700 [Rhododendron molle]
MIHFSHKDILWEIIGVKTLSISRLLRKITIQEPMFERIIVVYRRAKSKKESDRGIYVRHFKKIPMADMDIVLVTVVSSLNKSTPTIKVLAPILSAVIGFCAKTYLSLSVKEVIISFFILMEQSKATRQVFPGQPAPSTTVTVPQPPGICPRLVKPTALHLLLCFTFTVA